METKILAGIYYMTLEHHPNQREGTFIATITMGEYKGKSVRMVAYTAPAEEYNG